MINEFVRKWARRSFDAAAQFIQGWGMSPNIVTVIGFSFSILVGYLLAEGHTLSGGLIIILIGFLDGLDGALARITGQTSRFGAFLDSVLDRFSEAVIYLGLLMLYTRLGARQESLLIYATIVGSLMVSYARARAEGLGIECKIGLLTRLERLIILVMGLILNQMLITLWILATLTNFTALQRTYHVWRVTMGEQRETGRLIQRRDG